MTNPIPSSDLDALVEFQNEAARYFENCPVGGEDQAHWANVYNAENCRKTATAITSLRNQLTASEARERELREALAKIDFETNDFWISKIARRVLTNTENHHHGR